MKNLLAPFFAASLASAMAMSGAHAQQAVPVADGLAQGVASMQMAGPICGYAASPDRIFAALGVDPADPSFRASVEEKRQVMLQNAASWTPELKQEFCASIKELMGAVGF